MVMDVSKYEQRRRSVTRFAWKLKTGRDPGPLTISTHCQNKACVRYLFSRTRSHLGKATGGHPGFMGEDHPNAKLTAQQVLQIRKLYAMGKFQRKRPVFPSGTELRLSLTIR